MDVDVGGMMGWLLLLLLLSKQASPCDAESLKAIFINYLGSSGENLEVLGPVEEEPSINQGVRKTKSKLQCHF